MSIIQKASVIGRVVENYYAYGITAYLLEEVPFG